MCAGGKPGADDIDGWDLHPRIGAVMVGGVAWTLDLELRREDLQSWDGGTELASWNDDYMTVSADAKLPLVGLLYYEAQPGFATRFDTSDLMANGADPKDFLAPNYRQALGIGEVDWVGDFRSGYDLRLEDMRKRPLVPATSAFRTRSRPPLFGIFLFFSWIITDAPGFRPTRASSRPISGKTCAASPTTR